MPVLNQNYIRENQLQALNFAADRIERETGIKVVRCHLGNPSALVFKGACEARVAHINANRAKPGAGSYADVTGDKDLKARVATALTKVNRLRADEIDAGNIVNVTGGTGGLNLALKIFDRPIVLAPDPYYPPWGLIADHVKVELQKYKLASEDHFLPNFEVLDKKLSSLPQDRNIVLLYHYPNNPTGKTLSENEAQQVANTLNRLIEKHPNLHLVQEDLYLGTIAKDKGIYTPLPYLSTDAKNKTIVIHSLSKMGHARDRAAVMWAFNKEFVPFMRGGVSVDALGASEDGLVAAVSTLEELAKGIDPKKDAENYRYQLADYYQERMQIVAHGAEKIDRATGSNTKLLPHGVPDGTYYLYMDFSTLQGKDIPQKLLPVFSGKKKFENADDVSLALQNAHLLGLQPATTASGTLFESDPSTMHVRFAIIEPDEKAMHGLVNTLKGVFAQTLHKDDVLHADYKTMEQLRELYPANVHAAQLVAGFGGPAQPGVKI